MRSRPALQNIPIRTELGRRLRAVFGRENTILINADYTKFESSEALEFIQNMKKSYEQPR